MGRRAGALAYVACLSLGATHLGAQSWTHLAGNAARISIAPTAPRELSRIPWMRQLLPDEEFIGSSAPVVGLQRVFVNTRYVPGGQFVANKIIAFAASSGTRLWERLIAPDVADSWSAPAVDERNARVLIASDRTLYALDVYDGHIVWETTLARVVVNASPAISGDLLSGVTPANRAFVVDYAAFGTGALYAINVDPYDAVGNPFQPGQVVWSAAVGRTTGNSPAYLAGKVVVSSGLGTVHAFDARTGQPLWTTAASGQGFFGGVSVVNQAVYAATYNFQGGQNNSQLVKLDLNTGLVMWVTPCERTSSIPVVAGQTIYLSGGIDGFGSVSKVQAFRDLGTHAELLWDTYVDSGGTLIVGGWSHQPLLAGGYLYAGAPDPQSSFDPYLDLYILDATRTPADPLFRVARHTGSGGSPAAALGRLYSVGSGGLFAFEPDPCKLWTGREPCPGSQRTGSPSY